MKLIVGLGNPGKKYEHTRHNAGFLALDQMVESLKIDPRREEKFDAEILQAGNTLFVKPQTFMNESGGAVKQLLDFYKLDAKKDLLIIHDDTDLPLGAIRATDSSSAAGHKGVADIIEKLGTQAFHRLRIGVESRAARSDMPTEAFVLQPFAAEELDKLKAAVFPKVKLEIEKFLEAEI